MHSAIRACLTVAALAVTTGVAGAAGVTTEEITLRSGNKETKAFLARPEGPGRHPALVVIQEWWGLTDWIRDNARRLAAQGYVCLAPDLYHRPATDDPKVAMQLMRGLRPEDAVRDLKAAVDSLLVREDVRKDRVGCIGWCMGGGFSLQLALEDDRVAACVICYGRLITNAEKLRPLHAAVLGVFGEQDRGIPPKMVHQFEQALKQDDKPLPAIHSYKAGHGFMRPGAANPAYREEAAIDAWKQIDAFFAKTLGGK